MPKANKHAEVKPSKYKTSLCQYFVKGEVCPFAERCAFAHGEEELQSESKNVELLKVTGLQRLDRGGLDVIPTATEVPNTPSSNASNPPEDVGAKSVTSLQSPTTLSEEQNSQSDSFAATPAYPVNASPSVSSYTLPPPAQEARSPYYPVAPRQRRPVMVSLPKYGTANDQHSSPYNAQRENYSYTQFSINARAAMGTPAVSRHPEEPLQPAVSQRAQCVCGLASTCRRDQPTTYRHNPYGRLTDTVEYY